MSQEVEEEEVELWVGFGGLVLVLEGILVFIGCGWNMSSRLCLLHPKPRCAVNMFLRKLSLLFEDMRERERREGGGVAKKGA
ncbi:hypothetical protein LguiB_031549 [Lonicera macranthoides]